MTGEQALCHAHELVHRREVEAALNAFVHAETLGADPDQCCAGRWMAHMLHGDFDSAWAESDAMRQRGAPDPHRFWQGEDLRGKRVILRCLHGLGDAVQFFRYVPALRALAASVVVEVPPPLLELAPCFAGVEEVITWGADAPPVPPRWDVQVEINELPYLFRTTERHLPLATRYLDLPTASLQCAAPQANSALSLRVGMVWASGQWNPSRSIAFDRLRPLLKCRACEFWNLQGGSERPQWLHLTPADHLHHGAVCEDSLLGLAGTIAQLDLIVTTDTLAAHLAGALGVPAWVMLERAADWRWQHARDDSPWYPSLRLFRQEREGDWEGVVARVSHELSLHSLKRRVLA